jgi:hypothetical protein
MTSHVRKLVRLVPVALAIAFVLLGSRTVSAQCFSNLAACYQRAALRDTWWERSLAGADCELDFIDCTRRALIGR